MLAPLIFTTLRKVILSRINLKSRASNVPLMVRLVTDSFSKSLMAADKPPAVIVTAGISPCVTFTLMGVTSCVAAVTVATRNLCPLFSATIITTFLLPVPDVWLNVTQGESEDNDQVTFD